MTELFEMPAGGAGLRPSKWMRTVGSVFRAAALGVALAAEFSMFRGEGGIQVRDLAALCAAYIAASILNTVGHELGHLAAAVAMVMNPLAISVFGVRVSRAKGGGLRLDRSRALRNHVLVSPDPKALWLPFRFATFALAGPAVNLWLAVICYSVAVRSGAGPAHKAAWLSAAAVGAAIGIGNLVPAGSPASLASDGTKIIWWLFRPRAMRRHHARTRLTVRYARHQQAAARGEVPDLTDLRLLTECAHKEVASAAAARLLTVSVRTGNMPSEDEARFIRLAESGTMTPAVGGLLASSVAWHQIFALLQHWLRTRGQPDPQALAQTAQLAELGFARDPDSVFCRYVLAMVRAFQGRPAEGRALLVDIPFEQVTGQERVSLLSVRALIELMLGDARQARRLVCTARRENQASPLLDLAQRITDAAERHTTTGQTPIPGTPGLS